MEPLYLLNQCRQWQVHQTGMPTDTYLFFPPSQYNPQQYSGEAWKNQPPFLQPQAFFMPPWPNQSNPNNNNWPNSPYPPSF